MDSDTAEPLNPPRSKNRRKYTLKKAANTAFFTAIPDARHESIFFEEHDDYNVLYWGHIILALGYIWTFQCVIMAQSYYASVYPDSGLNASIMAATTWPLALMHLFQMLSGVPEILGISCRIIFGFLASAVIGILFIMLDALELPESNAVLCILVLAALVGQLEALIEGPLYCSAGLLPKRSFSQAVQVGNGGAGVIVWAVQVLIRLCVSGTGVATLRGTHDQFRVFFYVQVVVCLLCVMMFWHMRGTEAFTSYVREYTYNTRQELREAGYLISRKQACERCLSATRLVCSQALCQFVLYGTTLSMWPAIPGLACTGGCFGPGGSFVGWYMDLILGVYNVGDFLGKASTPLLRWGVQHFSDNLMLGLVMARSLFLVPLILASSAPQLYTAALANWVSLAAVLILGFSGGFLSTLGMMLAPKRVPKDLTEDAANVMVLSLFLGISSGATLSYGLVTYVLPIGLCA